MKARIGNVITSRPSEADMPFSRKKYLGVLWDIDGTLIDSEPLHDAAVIETLRKLGFGDIGSQLDMLGTTWDHIWQRVGGRPEQLGEFESLVAEFYLARISQLKPRLNVLDFVERFHQCGILQAGVSNSRRIIVDGNLRHLGIEHSMQAIISRDDCKKGKPDPEPYLNAAKTIGVDVRSCIAVEDSRRGAASSKNAGAFSVFWPQDPNLECNECDMKIFALSDFGWNDYLGLNIEKRGFTLG